MPRGDIIHARYPVLFKVKVLHHYFLDVGKTLFDNATSLEKLKILAEYDLRKILDIQPTAQTQRLLSGHQMLFKPHAQGFAVLCQGDAAGQVDGSKKPAVGEKLMFTVKIVDPYFLQYSAGFLQTEQVRVEKSTDGRSPDRFFKKLYRLANDPAGQQNSLSASPAIYVGAQTYSPEAMVQHDANGDGNVEFFIAQQAVTANTVPVLNANQNWLQLAQVSPQNTNLRYVNSADLIEVELGEDIPHNTFALIEIEATAGAGPAHVYDAGGNLVAPEFEARVKNRLTWWRHSLAPWVAGPLTNITQPEILPLTHRGKQKIDLTFQVSDGNNGSVALERKEVDVPTNKTPILPELTNTGSVKRLLSDIYI